MVKKYFILIIFVVSTFYLSIGQNNNDCKQFKTGVFYTYEGGEFRSKVKRDENYQYEKVLASGIKVKLKINWIDDCSCRLTFVKANKKYYQKFGYDNPNKDLIVKIYKIEGGRYWHKSRWVDQDEYTYEAEVFKVK